MPGPHASESLTANLKQQHPTPTTPATSASARAESPGCFTFYAPHDAKAAIKMFAQKGNSSIDEFPFCS